MVIEEELRASRFAIVADQSGFERCEPKLIATFNNFMYILAKVYTVVVVGNAFEFFLHLVENIEGTAFCTYPNVTFIILTK